MLLACCLLIIYCSLKILILSNAVLSMFPSCVDLFPLVQIHEVYAQIRFGKWMSLTFLYSLLYVPTCYHRHLFFTGFSLQTFYMHKHILITFAVMGFPVEVKTDNGPVNKSHKFKEFCQEWQILHQTGILYSL